MGRRQRAIISPICSSRNLHFPLATLVRTDVAQTLRVLEMHDVLLNRAARDPKRGHPPAENRTNSLTSTMVLSLQLGHDLVDCYPHAKRRVDKTNMDSSAAVTVATV